MLAPYARTTWPSISGWVRAKISEISTGSVTPRLNFKEKKLQREREREQRYCMKP